MIVAIIFATIFLAGLHITLTSLSDSDSIQDTISNNISINELPTAWAITAIVGITVPLFFLGLLCRMLWGWDGDMPGGPLTYLITGVKFSVAGVPANAVTILAQFLWIPLIENYYGSLDTFASLIAAFDLETIMSNEGFPVIFGFFILDLLILMWVTGTTAEKLWDWD